MLLVFDNCTILGYLDNYGVNTLNPLKYGV